MSHFGQKSEPQVSTWSHRRNICHIPGWCYSHQPLLVVQSVTRDKLFIVKCTSLHFSPRASLLSKVRYKNHSPGSKSYRWIRFIYSCLPPRGQLKMSTHHLWSNTPPPNDEQHTLCNSTRCFSPSSVSQCLGVVTVTHLLHLFPGPLPPDKEIVSQSCQESDIDLQEFGQDQPAQTWRKSPSVPTCWNKNTDCFQVCWLVCL